MNWKVLAGVVLVLYVSVTNAKERRDTVNVSNIQIQHGLSLAKELGDFVVAKEFTNVIGKLATAVTPYLGIVGPFVSFIMGFAESAELKAIKRLYTEVDNRFDKVDLQFAELRKHIDWSKTQIQYSDIEQKITAVNREFENIYKFSKAAVNTTSSAFVSNYESDYQNSGSKLYDGIMNEGGVFGESLFTAVAKSTSNHRTKCRTFMLGILRLLIKAATLELAYHQLKGHKAAIHDYKNDWATRFSHIKSKMLSTDISIVNQYHTQSGIDIDNYLIKHPKKSVNNYDFNNGLFAYLTDKYYWRDWFTVTYKDIIGGDKHWVKECDGHIKFRRHDRNVVVASVNSHKAHVDLFTSYVIVIGLHSWRKVNVPYSYGPLYERVDCDEAYNTFPASVKNYCDPYAANGIIAYTRGNGFDVHFKAAFERLAVWGKEKCSFVYVFG